MASSSGSPCAACKFLRRKCTAECVFSPYFPPDQPQKFANVHKIFGASNITKLLNELPPMQREDAVNSLAYEADARIKDPVYGCVGAISVLQRQIAHLQQELAITRSDIAKFSGANVRSASTSSGPSITQQEALMGLITGDHSSMMFSGNNQVSTPLSSQLSSPLSSQLSAREQQLLELQRQTQLPRDQILEQIARAGGGSYEAGLIALGLIGHPPLPPYPARHSSDGSSANTGGRNISPP